MSAIGGLLALRQIGPGNVIPAVLMFYMVATALFTVKRPSQHARQIDIAAMLAALTLGVVSVGFALFRDDDPGSSGAYPPATYFVFAAAALGLAAQDRRMIAAGGFQGAARLQRHLGRMRGALIVAITSFFLGQPRVFSGSPLESGALRVIPVVLVVAVTIYWKVRVSSRPLAALGDAT